ncbi:uncharacterized protein LACBIDRAFT_311100 [Laccaria bicolor S238N-H82]|uniref:Predicted protein n=1 Tax=Laccaria bicolor (strain S238N-H82 / ATCC MYA-4686) TaxID=486041 RepID=B0CZ88_LACBS|nr:uncharacterized protein LACBIDRAFT_311100 [Laccaria bicolor S238N-H82]EDR12108.1 predicted protein [Laccaria bicolor S238N-H82]|eukprot:XP_001876372.1 predicted protein [Laccaria bicolor S238N-H82]
MSSRLGMCLASTNPFMMTLTWLIAVVRFDSRSSTPPLPSHHKPMVVSATSKVHTTPLRSLRPSETKVAQANDQRALHRSRSWPHRLRLSQSWTTRKRDHCLRFPSLGFCTTTSTTTLSTDRPRTLRPRASSLLPWSEPGDAHHGGGAGYGWGVVAWLFVFPSSVSTHSPDKALLTSVTMDDVSSHLVKAAWWVFFYHSSLPATRQACIAWLKKHVRNAYSLETSRRADAVE